MGSKELGERGRGGGVEGSKRDSIMVVNTIV